MRRWDRYWFFCHGVRQPPTEAGIGGSDPSIFAPQPGQVSSNITKRVMNSLMTGIEFSTVDRAVRGTETLEGAIKGMCEGIPVGVEVGPPRSHQGQGRKTPEPTERRDHLAVPPSTPPRGMGTGEVRSRPKFPRIRSQSRPPRWRHTPHGYTDRSALITPCL